MHVTTLIEPLQGFQSAPAMVLSFETRRRFKTRVLQCFAGKGADVGVHWLVFSVVVSYVECACE
jgi:hypothetical protein